MTLACRFITMRLTNLRIAPTPGYGLVEFRRVYAVTAMMTRLIYDCWFLRGGALPPRRFTARRALGLTLIAAHICRR